MRIRTWVVFFAVAGPGAGAVRAELPSPRLDRIVPLGGSAGSAVEIEVTGNDLDDPTRGRSDHPDVKVEFVKDRKWRITIGNDVPEGTYDLRCIGRYGITNPRLFAVSRGLVETAKVPAKDPTDSQLIPLNSAVNGTSDQGREDRFRVAVKKGVRIVVDCLAQRLDSNMDAVLAVSDADGRPIASNGDYYGKDPLVEFVAPSDGEYVIVLNDLSYRGGMPYRMIVTDRPHVENVHPRAVQIGRPNPVTVFGRNLGNAAKMTEWRENDLFLQSTAESAAVDADVFHRRRFTFQTSPSGHSPAPTAATCTLAGFQHRGVPMLAVDEAVTLEQEPNDDPKKPQAMTLPAVVSGRFDRDRDADWFEFDSGEGGPFAVDVYCERIGGRADPYVVVLDDKDGRVSELDDFGIRMNAFDGHLRDPSGTINLSPKRKYRLLVQDRYRRGGPRYQYVLVVRKPRADFSPSIIHHQNPGPGGMLIRKGGASYWDLVMHLHEGYSGPVTFEVKGLPKGVHAVPTTINTDTRGVLVIWADKDAPDAVAVPTITAVGNRGAERLEREVRPHTRVWNSPDLNSSRPTRDLPIVVAESAPFSVAPVADRLEVEAGKKVELKLTCERIWPDAKAAISVTPLGFPGPIRSAAVVIPEGKSEITVTLETQAGMRTGTYTLAMQCQAQVPFTKDAKATTKPNTQVTVPSRPFQLTVLPAVKK